MRKSIICFFVILILIFVVPCISAKQVKADELTDSIGEQLGEIDLSGLEDYMNSLDGEFNEGVIEKITKMLSGEYSFDYSSFTNYFIKCVFNSIVEMLPMTFAIVVIALFLSMINSVKSVFLENSISEIIYFACIGGIILVVFSQIILVFSSVNIAIENLSKLNEIISPIILTLMVASGGINSASVFKPTSVYLSGGVIEVIKYAVFPLISIMFVFSILSNLSSAIKLKKTSDFISGIIKWIIGVIVSVFGIFGVVQGIGVAFHDGISAKAAKYVLSNSVPIIGGFLREGFDVIIAGSVLIKNTIGIAGVFMVFYTVLSPILLIASISLLLKLTAAIIEPFSDPRIPDFCMSVNRAISFLLVVLILVGVMFFINILLMIFSANAIVL